MSQIRSNTVYLGPGEVLYYSPYKTPTYKTPSALATWRTATITEATLEPVAGGSASLAAGSKDPQAEAAENWVLQLVRRELGPALSQVETEQDVTLAITVDAFNASLITAALQRMAQKESPAA
jgi:hypothetical protein